MKKRIGIAVSAVVVICLTTIFIIGAVTASDESKMTSAGEYLSDSMHANASAVAAVYNGHEILVSDIQYANNIEATVGTGEQKTDLAVINELIQGIIMVEEAERRGLAATEAEIQEMVDMAKEAYTIPSGKELLDDYCAGAGITLEEYYARLRSQAPTIIAKQKLIDAIGEAYCQEKGIPFTKVNQPPEVQEAVDAYMAELFAAHQDEIEYFMD